MRRSVALVGFRRTPPRCGGAGFVRLPAGAVLARRLGRFEWIVLGGDTVASVDPIRAVAALAGLRDRVIVCPEDAALRRVVVWAGTGLAPFLERAEIRDAVSSPRRGSPRPLTPLHEWIGRDVEPGSAADELLRALEATRSLHVEEWAGRIGCSERSILRRCRKLFGLRAYDVAVIYRAFLDDHWDAAGIRARDRAAGLGLADEFGVWRARRKRRATSDERRATSDERRATSDERRATSDEPSSAEVSEKSKSSVRIVPVRNRDDPGSSAPERDEPPREGSRGAESGGEER